MTLNSTSKHLEIFLGGAIATNELQFSASYVDVNRNADTKIPGDSEGVTSGTTAITLISPPKPAEQRLIEGFFVYNSDTVAQTITIQINNGTDLRVLIDVTLNVADTLFYTEEEGFKVIDTTGGIKTTVAGAFMGTVTNFSAGNLSPLFTTTVANPTTTPSLTFTLSNQSANLVFAGPTTGAASPPTFRSLVTADLPAGTGTVTTVSVVTNQGVSGSVANPTTTPAITISLGALTGVTSLNGLVVTANTGVVTTGTWNASTITETHGGTNQTTYTTGDILYASAANTLSKLAATSNSYVLTLSGGIPVWAPTTGGTVTSVSVVTNQGVSGSVANPTTTPAITLSLGALTGVTSFNGLIITANTGVVTTGTWNASVVSPVYGGTGIANNVASTITVSGNFASTFTVSAANNYTFPATTSTLLANSLGISGGTTLIGDTTSGGNLKLQSTSNATKGLVYVSSTSTGIIFDEVNNRIGIGIAPTQILDITKDQNANTLARISNGTSGTGASISIQLNGSSNTNIFNYNTSFTTVGLVKAQLSRLGSTGTNGMLIDVSTGQIIFAVGGTATTNEISRATTTGVVFNGGTGTTKISSCTAYVHIAAGTATASTAPIKLTSGTNLTVAETGAIEYNGTNLFFTRTGTTREGVLVGNRGATAPSTAAIGVLLSYFGTSATVSLNTPNTWFGIVGDDGNTYKIPGYS